MTVALLPFASPPAKAQDRAAASPEEGRGEPQNVAPMRPIYIREYRVIGARELPKIAVEEAVYPFLGPGRTEADVEAARGALEKAYHEQGFQAATVQVPLQQGRGGIVVLEVHEGTVGRLRVKGSRYFLPSAIKARAQSLAEGRAVNFNNVSRDIVSLNQLPDRQVTPSLRAGQEPGTVDVDLTVKDTLPLHGSVELNNRYSVDTPELRLSGSLSYGNLWQLGHTLGASFQVAPEDTKAVRVYSGYYIARFPNVDWLSLSLQATKQDSNVSTLGGLAVAGRGEVVGARAIMTLPPGNAFFHSATFGVDYKNFDQDVVIAGISTVTPVTYYPVSAAYSATWAPKGSTTELNLGVTFGFRGVGSRSSEFAINRFDADANFIYLRGDLSHTRNLPGGFEGFAKVQGQIADQALVNSEQYAGGGLGTVRGYLEAEVLGDNAVFGTLEVRSPSLFGFMKNYAKANEWRLYIFGDAGTVTLHSPLPEQEASFKLASVGIGSRLRLFNHINGSVDVALPLIGQTTTEVGETFVTFRAWADF